MIVEILQQRKDGFAYITAKSTYGTFKCWVYVAVPLKLSDGTLQFAGDLCKSNNLDANDAAYILDLKKKGSWTKDELSIADINGDGKITNADSDLILDIYTKSCFSLYKATGIPLNKISFSQSNIEVVNGEKRKINVTKDPINATSENTLIWSSSNVNVATIDNNGILTAKQVGTATITVKTTDGTKTATCKVTVKKPTYMLGDVNEDGKVNTLDAVKILQSVAKKTTLTNTQSLAGDTNKDGKVNTLDAVKILQYVAKKITKF